MECNKEEAVRAKDIGERKMQCRDFVGARKMVLKAQQLFPDLENILQMLTVCEVHCSAEAKVNGSEDWYGILQVEPTADDSLIKKQYKKLAFLLHPDKNKYAGAEAAFKLVGEAQRTLTDQTKRSVYDLKRTASIKTVGSKPQSHHPRTSSTGRQPAAPTGYPNQAATPFASVNQAWAAQATYASQTFWTACPLCGIRYQYYRSIVNRALRCQNCLKPFIAYDINEQGVPTGENSGYPLNRSGIHQHKDSEVQKNAGEQSHGGGDPPCMDTQKNAGGRPTVPEPVTRVFGQGHRNKTDNSSGVENGAGGENEVKVEKVKLEKVNKRESVAQSSGNAKQKRRRKVAVESNGAESSDSEVVFAKTGNAAASNRETTSSRSLRRSARQKQNVAYHEDNSDADDFVNSTSPEQSRRDGSSHNGNQSGKLSSENDVEEQICAATPSKNKSEGTKRSISTEEGMSNGNKPGKHCVGESGGLKGKDKTEEVSKDSGSLNTNSKENKVHSTTVLYPDPEFHDFDEDKDSKSFSSGQIWAMYDNLDGMPRFYARIKSVSSAGFKLHFTWLEYVAVDQAEMDWYAEELPVACGNFKPGKTQVSEETRMFSHLVSWRKGSERNSYGIYPRKGEIWALFKGWDIEWKLDPDQHREHKYKIVEILSDFSLDTGVDVVSLVKVKGFVSLFCHGGGKGVGILHIPASDLLMFSHMVPSYRMTGKEREGIPGGIYELDCASLPINLEKMFPSVTLGGIRGNVEDSGHTNGVPAFNSVTRQRKSADELQNQCTLGNSEETSVKIQVERPLESNDPSPEGLSRKRKNSQPSGSKFAATDAGKIASEKMPSERLVSDKEKRLNAPRTSNNAMENHNDAMPDPSSPMCFFYPDSEFYNFDFERFKERFETGQIWALYCDYDGFPKYYALVRKVESGDFKVHITWLEACPLLQEEIQWSNNDLPFGCGRFRLCSGRDSRETYETIETFSHMVWAVHVEKRQQYDIYPQVNEVWALYVNWNVTWKSSDLENCLEKGEYEVVEVSYRSDSVITVMVLEKVDGFRAVFRRKRKNESFVTMEILRSQFLKFSHRIPSFRLTEQRGGKLRDCWELDPAAVPDILLCTKID